MTDPAADERSSGRARKGNAALRAALCKAAWSASRTRDTYLSAHYWHLLRRFGKKGRPRPPSRSGTRYS